MYDLRGRSALVTGGGSGIGKQLVLDLARKGCLVTVADVDGSAAQQVADEVQRTGGSAKSLRCDVTSLRAQEQMFEQHIKWWGGLELFVANAGIGERAPFLRSRDGWQQTLEIDLKAVIHGTQIAIEHMLSSKTKGVILLTASAGGLFPMSGSPVYAASKAGVVNFTRSLAPPLGKRGIRICAVCPQIVDTPMISGFKQLPGIGEFNQMAENLLTAEDVSKAFVYLAEDETRNGTLLLLHGKLKKAFEWREPTGNLKPVNIPGLEGQRKQQSPEQLQQLASWATRDVPAESAHIQVHRLSTDFRESTRLVHRPLKLSAPKGHVLMRRVWAGINASDINYTAGKYFGSVKESEKRLPFDSGFEAVGVIAAVGDGVTGLHVGQPIAEMSFAAFSDWGVVPAKSAIPVARPAPEVVALLTSGLTASISLEVAGRMTSKETVLVTAAAGGTGQFAVQLAKAAGNHVIATCSSSDKAAMLKRLGADRVINYKTEDLRAVLKKEYPKGVDIVWEGVGGAMLETCVRALAIKGRLIVIGMVSQYASGWEVSQLRGLPEQLLGKSASVTGFFLPQYFRRMRAHLPRLVEAWGSGRLQVSLDPRKFVGLESVPDAVDHLHSGKSMGKVVVQLAPQLPPFTSQAKL
ncbi:hypothetical protein WJX73_007858 [Symbiochloris irregularis]|uniref:Enoyl reductase (ER) domain-containing protein n=1 Tax=Symbiochloris irregularis TaxID=706552 RepID=A0AAW1PBE8_9CHLO